MNRPAAASGWPPPGRAAALAQAAGLGRRSAATGSGHRDRVARVKPVLERVVANIVDNALRHGAGSPVAIRASAHHVELRVVDHGPGIPPGSAPSMFTPFQRLGDRDTTTGIGLGLSVAQGFTDAMDGSLTVEDTPGGGLTLVICLPAASKMNQVVR
jgi:signal transduction histidine kinase